MRQYARLPPSVCHCAGGFTGSYIFSQTIFTCRARIDSRIVGWVVAVLELGVCLLPFSATDYIPNFFFGAALIYIGFDLMYEWLVDVFHRLTFPEYARPRPSPHTMTGHDEFSLWGRGGEWGGRGLGKGLN